MLGLGPGIDYAAVGESMAMAAVMKDARRAQAYAEDRWHSAQEHIRLQGEIIDDLKRLLEQNEAKSLGGAVDVYERMSKENLAQAQRHHAQIAKLQDMMDAQHAAAKREAESYTEVSDALRAELAMMCALHKGSTKMILALAEALAEAVPNHPMVSPTGENGSDGQPMVGADAPFEAAFAAFAAKTGVKANSGEAIEQAGKTAARLVAEETGAASRHRAPVYLETKRIF